MKKILSLLFVILLLSFGRSAIAAPFVYFNWDNQGDNGPVRIVLYGLPESPVIAEVTKVPNPDDPADVQYYRAEYDLKDLPDGSYTLTGKMKNIWGTESLTESPPYPFVKGVPGGISNVHLDF